MRYTNSTNPQAGTFRAWLNSTTQISFYSTNSIYVLYYSWEVIEYE